MILLAEVAGVRKMETVFKVMVKGFPHSCCITNDQTTEYIVPK